MREESEWSYTQMIPKDAPYINIIELVPYRSGYIPENFVLEILHEGRPVGTCSGQSWVIFYEHGMVIKSINSDHAKAFVIPSET